MAQQTENNNIIKRCYVYHYKIDVVKFLGKSILKNHLSLKVVSRPLAQERHCKYYFIILHGSKLTLTYASHSSTLSLWAGLLL